MSYLEEMTYDEAIDNFYADQNSKTAQDLATIVQQYNNDEMIGDGETQTVLQMVAPYLERENV